MITYDDQSPEIQKRARGIERVRASNAYRTGELEKIGIGLDLTVARVDHLIDSLRKMSVISVQQALDIHEEWEVALSGQLDGLEKRIREQIPRNKQKQSDLLVAQKSGLLGPNGQQLKS